MTDYKIVQTDYTTGKMTDYKIVLLWSLQFY